MRKLKAAPADVRRLVLAVRSAHHEGLARTTMTTVMVETDGEIEPVTVKVNGVASRAAGAADFAVLIDQAAWSEATEAERLALVDNALAGLRTVWREGELVVDAAFRPVLRRRKPAFRLAVHEDVLGRHLDRVPGIAAVKAVDRAVRRGKRHTATVGA